MSEKREVLELWFRRVWEQEQAGAIDELFVPDPNIVQLGVSMPLELESFKELHRQICKQLRNIDIKIDMSIEQGDWISVLCSCYARDAVTGEDVTVSGNVLCMVKDGKIRGGYQNWDFMGMWDQIGLLPGDSFQKCLHGQKLA